MITGLLVVSAIVAGVAALVCAAVSGMALEQNRKSEALSIGWVAVGLLVVALALMLRAG
jgi:hypothetical protein